MVATDKLLYAGRWRYKQRTNMAVVEYKSGRQKLETQVVFLATSTQQVDIQVRVGNILDIIVDSSHVATHYRETERVPWV